jgi:hypothetical protein
MNFLALTPERLQPERLELPRVVRKPDPRWR